jgi:hypothetical protein
VPCINNNARLQINAVRKEDFKATADQHAVDRQKVDALWDLFVQTTLFSEREMLDALTPHFQQLPQLNEIWSATPLCRLSLTAVGIALGHANLRRLHEWDADLSIWIN